MSVMQDGEDCALAALESERVHIEALPEAERVKWWGGFLTAAIGAMVGSMGEPAAQALREALSGGH